MKKEEREKARELRSKGYSIKEITKIIGVAKSSISLWVRDINLNPDQIENLSRKGRQESVIEKRRKTRLENEDRRRQIIVDNAQKEITKLLNKELWLVGVMLYWAEGGKTQRGLVRFSNGDPEMIKIMMAFFRKICHVPKEKFRGYIHIHPHLDHEKAEKYWSHASGISLNNFFKTYRKINISSKNKKDSLPFGVMDIYICNTELFLKITGWAKGIFSSY
jgi:hypothetical protein